MKFGLTVRPNKNDTYTVYILYSHDSEKYRLSTKVKVRNGQWKSDTKQLIRMKDHEVELIDDLMIELKEFVRNRKEEGKSIDVYSIKNSFHPKDRKQSQGNQLDIDQSESMVSVFKRYIEIHKESRADRTIKAYITVYHDLVAYEKKNGIILFENMNLDFESSYRSVLYKRGLIDNTVGSRLKIIKTFLRWALDNGYDVHPEFRKFKAEKTKSRKSSKCYLLINEIKDFANVPLEGKNLNLARDLFLLQCFTGLAISDLKELNRSHIHNDIIEKKRFKTDKDIFTPLSPEAKNILIKYDFSIPSFNEILYNRYIKTIAKKAGIDRAIHQTAYRKGKKIILDSKPLHELLSTHDGVKSFITMAYYEWDYNVEEISEMTSKTVRIIENEYLGRNRKRIQTKMALRKSLI